MNKMFIRKRGAGWGVHKNINSRAVGIDPYKLYYHYLTPFGKIVFINSPMFTELHNE